MEKGSTEYIHLLTLEGRSREDPKNAPGWGPGLFLSPRSGRNINSPHISLTPRAIRKDSNMRIVFIGTPDFAVPSLEKLLNINSEVCLTVTKPDSRRGRGRQPARSAVKDFALKKRLKLYQPSKLSSAESAALLKHLKPDAGVIVAFGEILAPWLIDMFPHGLFNLHASLLPKYRGAAPINHALLNGEKRTGVTVQRVVPEIDAGPVLKQSEVEIGPEENAGELHDRLSTLGAHCLAEVFSRLNRRESVAEHEQTGRNATHAPKLQKDDGRIDWTQSAESIRNQVRAMTPWPGAFCTYKGKGHEGKVDLIRVYTCGSVGSAKPGTVTDFTENEDIIVASGDGNGLIIKTLKPAGGRTMKASDFVHGRHLKTGERFE